jgi:dTDP-4-dehydrorhamnose 3,5-epimerase
MKITTTPIPGLLVLQPAVFEDDRGYFFESFNNRHLEQAGVQTVFVQDNQSRSMYGVIRGLHYQLEPYAQAKLVRVLEGSVLDVAVDIREGSPTYGQSFSIELSAENRQQLYIPRGFAHGFSVLSPYATFFYKCDNYYAKEYEGGILWNDATLAIDWQIPADKSVLSAKDIQLPTFGNHRSNFTFQP